MIQLIMLSFLTAAAKAETLQLKDGSVLSGSINKSDADIVELQTPDGVLRIKTDRIKTIDYAVEKASPAPLHSCPKGTSWQYGHCYPDQPMFGARSTDNSQARALAEPRHDDARPGSVEREPRPTKLRLYGMLETFLAADAGDDLWTDAQAGMRQLSGVGYSTVGTLETNSAIGGRLGVIGSRAGTFDLGASIGYISGPKSNVSITATGGGRSAVLSDARKMSFVRFLVEPAFNAKLTESSVFHLGAGIGVASGHVKETFSCQGTACATNGVTGEGSSSWSGFTWEVAPSISISSFDLGFRFAGFPGFDGNSQNSKIAWTTAGFFAGLRI